MRRIPAEAIGSAGTSGLGLISSGREVSVKVYGVADDDAAGVEPDA
jgi:hypothetical protein